MTGRALGPREAGLAAGTVLSMFGDSALLIVLAIWVKTLTGSDSAAGAVFLLVALPAVVAPGLGWVVDLCPRRAFLVGGNLASVVAVLPLLLVDGPGRVWLVYAVALVYGISLITLGAALNGLVKDMVSDDALGTVNSVLQVAREGLRLVAPLAGAGLYAAAGPRSVVLIDAVSFVAAATAFLAIPPPAASAGAGTTRRLSAGFAHVVALPPIRQVALALGGALFVVGFIESVIFAAVEDGLHRPPAFIGVLLSLQGAGAIVGGSTAGWLSRRLGEVRVVGLGIGLFGLGVAGLATGRLAPALIGMVVAGCGLPMSAVASITLMQRLTPSELVGRVSTALDFVIGVPQVVSIAVGAVLLLRLDYRVLLLAMTAVQLAIGARLLLRPAPVPPTGARTGAAGSARDAARPADAPALVPETRT